MSNAAQTPEAVIRSLFEVAKTIIESGEEHVPMGFVVREDGAKAAVQMPSDKNQWPDILRLASFPGASCAVLISEAWVRHLENEPIPSGSLEHDVQAGECLIFSLLTHSGRQYLSTCPIARKKRGVPAEGDSVTWGGVRDLSLPLDGESTEGRLVVGSPLQ